MKNDKLYAQAITNKNIDLNKDFFELTHREVSIIDELRKVFKFSGRNNLGREPVRQFYYAAQRGMNK